jgi:L-rhamnose isomerase
MAPPPPLERRHWIIGALALGVIAYVIGTWPADAVPSLKTHCDTCISLGGGKPDAPRHAVFADSGTARFFKRIGPAHFWLWVALSPVGWLVIAGVRWLAGKLHEARANPAP